MGKIVNEHLVAFRAGFNQALRQPKERAEGNDPMMDLRRFDCPSCGSFGMNTMSGVVIFACGAELTDDEFYEPCGEHQPVQEVSGDE